MEYENPSSAKPRKHKGKRMGGGGDDLDNNFRKIETDILQWVSINTDDKRIKDQIKSAVFVERKWTKVGFYVDFEVDKFLEPLTDIDRPIDGPLLISKDIEYDGFSFIWDEDGYLNCIEMVATGNFFRENISEYSFKDCADYNSEKSSS